MADNRKAVGGGCLTHTLHVWPTQEVVVQSVYWPPAWHQLFERAARELGQYVAGCVLGGRHFGTERLPMDLRPAGRLEYSVHASGTSIWIDIWAFEGPEDPGPDAPGPNGGERYRSTADGLVLGLRGTGKDFSIATFYHGPVPTVPAGRGERLRVRAMKLGMTSPNGAQGGSNGSRAVQLAFGIMLATHAAPDASQTAQSCERPVYCAANYAMRLLFNSHPTSSACRANRPRAGLPFSNRFDKARKDRRALLAFAGSGSGPTGEARSLTFPEASHRLGLGKTPLAGDTGLWPN